MERRGGVRDEEHVRVASVPGSPQNRAKTD